MYAGRTRGYDCPYCGEHQLIAIDIQPDDYGYQSCVGCEKTFRWDAREGEPDVMVA